ncbi:MULTISPECIES: phosphotransferase [unclassified Mycoplasma]|uniref:phosphotransferase n=1 Tax=unclassified Mycoplasma TaxID=2683645 RepID=UPI00216B0721|nr:MULTISPECIES: phosphotransferase [unclassified Mycoplasma]MCS4537030.1 phosphotransferase [Mycoplasma sp. CSL7475-4]MCT4469401.1 phosphotransferase [Mycoplasma sp. HS2188]
MKIKIEKGHTNISYRYGDKFIQEKVYNGFNHKIDYTLLEKFDFVPKLLEEEQKEIVWEFIEGAQPTITLENAELIAKQVRQIHESKLPFPPSNHAARVKFYRRQLKECQRSVQVLEDFYRPINKTLANMRKDTPLHNDLWPFNMIEQNDKIFFIDWEYATLGDKHFELAYIIEASSMSKEVEDKFLQAYGDYNEVFLLRHKMLVNYLVILWVHTQTQPPFNTDEYAQRIYKYDQLLKEMLNS